MPILSVICVQLAKWVQLRRTTFCQRDYGLTLKAMQQQADVAGAARDISSTQGTAVMEEPWLGVVAPTGSDPLRPHALRTASLGASSSRPGSAASRSPGDASPRSPFINHTGDAAPLDDPQLPQYVPDLLLRGGGVVPRARSALSAVSGSEPVGAGDPLSSFLRSSSSMEGPLPGAPGAPPAPEEKLPPHHPHLPRVAWVLASTLGETKSDEHGGLAQAPHAAAGTPPGAGHAPLKPLAAPAGIMLFRSSHTSATSPHGIAMVPASQHSQGGSAGSLLVRRLASRSKPAASKPQLTAAAKVFPGAGGCGCFFGGVGVGVGGVDGGQGRGRREAIAPGA